MGHFTYLLLFKWKGTALQMIWQKVLHFMLYASLVVYMSEKSQGVVFPMGDKLSSIIPLVIGQLLNFRTATAYERWNEGRKAWSTINVLNRTFMRTLLLSKTKDSTGLTDGVRRHYNRLVNLLLAYSLSVKKDLRQNYDVDDELSILLPTHVKQHQNKYLPNDILMVNQIYLQYYLDYDIIDKDKWSRLINVCTSLGDQYAVMERIKTSPMPFAYHGTNSDSKHSFISLNLKIVFTSLAGLLLDPVD